MPDAENETWKVSREAESEVGVPSLGVDIVAKFPSSRARGWAVANSEI